MITQSNTRATRAAPAAHVRQVLLCDALTDIQVWDDKWSVWVTRVIVHREIANEAERMVMRGEI